MRRRSLRKPVNYLMQILNVLARGDGPSTLVMAPSAPPVLRGPDGIQVALTNVFSPTDVNDTLAALRSQATGSETGGIGRAGVFSLGIKGTGRFRVSYFTQRGSRVVNIVRVPVAAPDLETLCPDAAVAKRATDLVRGVRGGIVVVFGEEPVLNGLVAYSLLRRLNESERNVLYILERSLTFLMPHGSCVVLQCEVGVDVQTFEEGVQNALLVRPDLMYVGDMRVRDDMASIYPAVEQGTGVILSVTAQDRSVLVNRFRANLAAASGGAEGVLREMIRVVPAGGHQVRLDIAEAIKGPAHA